MASLQLDEALRGEVVAWRRHLHAHPELGYQEHETSAFVVERLQEFGYQPKTGIAETGVVALAGAADGPTILARADMDALPIHEENDVEYRSQHPGVMHACGHDGHTAMLLAVARIVSRLKGDLPGRVKFMFQPAEEGLAGAKRMVEEGVLENPPVDAAFACHLWASLEVGKIGVRSGPLLAATDSLDIVIRGAGGHAASPHLAVDPVVAACQVVTSLQSIVSRSVDPVHSAVVTIGSIHGGEARNVIPPDVALSGTIRTFRPEVRELVCRRAREVVEGVCAAAGAQAEVRIVPGYPATVNDAEMTDLVRQAAAEVVGAENVVEMDPTLGGEDMAFVLERVPGSFFCVGARNEARGIRYPHHNPRFDVDEAALPIGAETMARVIETALRHLGR